MTRARSHTPLLAAFALALLTVAPVATSTATAATAAATPTSDRSGASAERAYGRLPLAFVRDGRGFTARTSSGAVTLRRGVATVVPTRGTRAGAPVRIGLAGARSVQPQVQRRLPGVVNDLRGDDRGRWRTGIPTFGKIRYAGVYRGIDLDYHGTTGTLEYDFRVAPGADPGRIAVDFHGAALRLTRGGDLVVGRGADRLRQAAPVAYQRSAGARTPVAARFVLRGDRVGFRLGSYDRTRPLVIDPLVLSYATLLGGTDEDRVNDVAVDATGATYLAGYTVSTNFPTTPGAYDTTRAGIDAIVTKLNPAGSALVYSTLLGGSETDFANSIAVDASGNTYVAGSTASNRTSASTMFPTTAGALVTTTDIGFGDAFVTKLNPAGNALVYSAAFGGSSEEEVRAISVDAGGSAYVGGMTASTTNAANGFPTSAGAYQTVGGSSQRDGFVAKLDGTGARVYATYLGGTGQDEVNGLDVDSVGRAYVTGFATAFSGNNFPTTPANRYRPVDDNSADAFLSRLSTNGQALEYSTGIGTDGNGTGNDGSDTGIAVAVGPTDGTAYITGTSRTGNGPNGDFPLKHQYEGRDGGCCFGQDVFLSKFDTTAAGEASLLYSTLIGGSGADGASAIDVDADGNAYIGGVVSAFSSGSPYDTTPDELGGGTNRGSAFLTKVVQSGAANATLGFSTTIQGTSPLDSVGGVVHDDVSGATYVAGTSRSGSLLTTAGAFQTTGQGDRDGFAVKITSGTGDTTPPQTTITTGPAGGSTVTGNPVAFSFSANETSTFECSYDGAAFTACSSPGPGLSGSDSRTLGNGGHTFSVRARDTAGNLDASPDSRSFTVTVATPPPPPPADTTPPDTTVTKAPPTKVKVKKSATVAVAFAATEAGSTFTCQVDSGPAKACTSPATFKLGIGKHTITIVATDAAGNRDASPAVVKVTVKKKKPKKK